MKLFWCGVVTALVLVQLPAQAACLGSPTQRTQTFYDWYLGQFIKGVDVLNEKPKQLHSFVSKSFTDQLRQQFKRPDMMYNDPFLQAQDYMDDWIDHVVAKSVAQSDVSSTQKVTLGNMPETMLSVTVQLKSDQGCWKISGVNPEQLR